MPTRELTGLPPADATASLPFPEVVVKLGADGALSSAGSRIAALPVPVVDTTGAGDAFAAGYLKVRVEGGSTDEALASGAAAGARAVTKLGARP